MLRIQMKLPATSTMKVYFNVGIILASMMMMMMMAALQQKTDTFDCSQKFCFDGPDFTDKSHFVFFRLLVHQHSRLDILIEKLFSDNHNFSQKNGFDLF